MPFRSFFANFAIGFLIFVGLPDAAGCHPCVAHGKFFPNDAPFLMFGGRTEREKGVAQFFSLKKRLYKERQIGATRQSF